VKYHIVYRKKSWYNNLNSIQDAKYFAARMVSKGWAKPKGIKIGITENPISESQLEKFLRSKK